MSKKANLTPQRFGERGDKPSAVDLCVLQISAVLIRLFQQVPRLLPHCNGSYSGWQAEFEQGDPFFALRATKGKLRTILTWRTP